MVSHFFNQRFSEALVRLSQSNFRGRSLQKSYNLTLSCAQADDARQTLLERLLDLSLKLHALDQSDQPSGTVERRFRRVHCELTSTVQLDQPFQVTREDQVYLVSLSPVGVTYQHQGSLKGALQATA